jgi:tetratricopeptide (TPR) repeat protein
VDLFIVDSLTTLVQGEIDKGKVNTASLVDAANTITQVRTLVSSADGLLRAGRVADAEASYGQALAAIPEIGKSYAYFSTKARNSEAARQDALRAGLSRAESAFAAGRYPEMLAAYRDALGYLPESSARLAATLSNIGAGAVALSGQLAQADQTQAAAPALAQANSLLQQRRYADAAGQYLAVLQSYPQSAQAGPSVKGINDSVAALSAQASTDLKGQSDQVTALNAQLASVRKDISDRTTEITGIKKSLMNLVGMSGDPASTPTDVVMNAVNKSFGGLSGAQGASGDVAARLQQAQNNAQALQKQIDTLSAENARLKGSPQNPAARPSAASGSNSLDSLVAGYRSYIDQEDSIIRAQGEEKGRMRTIGLRDQFLGSLDGVFRGILDRIHQYDDRFITDSLSQGKDEGRQDALQLAMGVVLQLSRQTSADQRKGFLDAQLRDADKDPAMKAFLKNLQILSAAMK